MRILVVENDERVREPIVEGLRQAGYETFEASDGPEALTLLELHKPEVLVADVLLAGGITGWEVAEQGRALDPDLVVIYASGFAPERSREVPGSRHLTKPFKAGEIVAAATEMALAREQNSPDLQHEAAIASETAIKPTGRGSYLVTKALAYAIEAIDRLPLDARERNDRDEMSALLKCMAPKGEDRSLRKIARAHLELMGRVSPSDPIS
jgi:CheY-like chemotaxis protein